MEIVRRAQAHGSRLAVRAQGEAVRCVARRRCAPPENQLATQPPPHSRAPMTLQLRPTAGSGRGPAHGPGQLPAGAPAWSGAWAPHWHLCSSRWVARSMPAPSCGLKTCSCDQSMPWAAQLLHVHGLTCTHMQSGPSAATAACAAAGAAYVASTWAAWMCGGIAVPLATSHPAQELQYVLEDAGVSAVSSYRAAARPPCHTCCPPPPLPASVLWQLRCISQAPCDARQACLTSCLPGLNRPCTAPVPPLYRRSWSQRTTWTAPQTSCRALRAAGCTLCRALCLARHPSISTPSGSARTLAAPRARHQKL